MITTTMTTNPAPLGEADARELTEQIAEGLADVHSLIVQAWEGRAWEALGYETWDGWIDANFRGLQLRPPREQRKEVVQSMREAGMSVRAISHATDLGVGTIHRATAGVPNGTPAESSNVVGLDGKSYTLPEPKAAEFEDRGSVSLTDLGVLPIGDSTQRQEAAPAQGFTDEALSGDVAFPESGEDLAGAEASAEDASEAVEGEFKSTEWDMTWVALSEAEKQCHALLRENRKQPGLLEGLYDPLVVKLTMAAARTVLSTGGVIVELGVEHLTGEDREALRKVLSTVIESLDGVIGDLEEADDDQA